MSNNENAKIELTARLQLFRLKEELRRGIVHFSKFDNPMAKAIVKEMINDWNEIDAELHKKVSITI
jgi:hypothetical protein